MARGAAGLLVAVDFDGTLAPLARRPGLARLPSEARRALSRLASRPGVTVAVVSGRALASLRPKVGLPGLVYAGNHGLEVVAPGWRWRHPGLAPFRAPLRRALREARALASGVPGAWVEDKGWSLSVHVREVRSKALERTLSEGLRYMVRAEPELRLTPGKRVYEVRTRIPWDKGDSVLIARLHLAPGAALAFIGDDDNDEEAFRTLGPRAWTVKVGGGPSAARWRARGPREVARLLAALADATAPA